MLSVEGNNLAPRHSIGKQLVEIVRLNCLGVVAHISDRQQVFVGQLTVNFDSKIVFIRYFLTSERKHPGITIAQKRTVRQRVKRIDETKYIGIDGNASGGKVSSARGRRGDGVHRGHTE